MAGELARLIRQRFGQQTDVKPNRTLSSVGIAATRLWAADGDRLAALVVNLSANTLFVGPFPNVASTRGIRLNPNGGQLELLWDEDFDLVGYEWFVIADAAASNLLTLEWLATGARAEAA